MMRLIEQCLLDKETKCDVACQADIKTPEEEEEQKEDFYRARVAQAEIEQQKAAKKHIEQMRGGKVKTDEAVDDAPKTEKPPDVKERAARTAMRKKQQREQ